VTSSISGIDSFLGRRSRGNKAPAGRHPQHQGGPGFPERSRRGADKIILYDGKTIPYNDGEVDILFCNSVIEHVPPGQREELVGKSSAWPATMWCRPQRGVPIELHFMTPFLHWLPRAMGGGWR